MCSVVAAWLSLGCARTESAENAQGSSEAAPVSEPVSPQAEPTAPPPEPPSFGSREAVVVEVNDHYPALMLVPRVSGDISQARFRVTFIAHGAGGRGVDHCLFWNEELPRDMILLCPAGVPLDRRAPDGGSYFADHLKLRAELRALEAALKEAFGLKLRETWRYMGYSQGATMGALAAVPEMAVFTELVLIEGGGENFTLSRAGKFKTSGGTRVLFACGTKGCRAAATRSRKILSDAGIEATFEYAPGAGHTYGEGVREAVLRGLSSWPSEPEG